MIEFYGGYQVYSESGVDLTLLRENLRLSLEERIEHNTRFLPFLEELKNSWPGRKREPSMTKEKSNWLNVESILKRLDNLHAQFVLIGGLAMRAHGSAHVTEDMDICYARTQENFETLCKVFADIHAYLRGAPPGLPFRFDVPTIKAGLNFTLTTDEGDVDLLGEISGIGNYEKVLAMSEECEIFGISIQVLSLDGLIAAKKAAGRAKDQAHLLELEEMKKMRDDLR